MNEWPAAVIILLFGFALLTEHYWSRMFLKLFQNMFKARNRAIPKPSLTEALVADTEQNRSSSFWCQYIDQRVKILRRGPDGLADVSWEGQPVEVQGVALERFMMIDPGPDG